MLKISFNFLGPQGAQLVIFPHANNFDCSDQRFIAHWIVWFEHFALTEADPLTDAMPRYPGQQSLAAQLAAGRRFSVDVLARCLAPPQYRNTLQASQEFVQVNASIVEPFAVTSTHTGRNVQGLRLTDYAREIWKALSQDQREAEILLASATIEADLDVDGDSAPTVLLSHSQPLIPTSIVQSASSDRASLVFELVGRIHEDPFQPHYRLRPHGEAVTGWPNRLRSYFWPRPTQSYSVAASQTFSFAERAAKLVEAVQAKVEWSESHNAAAVQLAEDIFTWGGVRQSTVTAQRVRAVFENANAGEIVHPGAPMNSGWTKVAAFASAHLEAFGKAQVIWDSRVSTSLIARLDALLVVAGVTEPSALFPEIGLVRGRGSFRGQRQ
ncbi:MAG: hypothetical protein KGS44_16535, partial [Alphaproteobacteria bacterium]|nr:hypothetical protein [Alphaproteobacteria bacterium]